MVARGDLDRPVDMSLVDEVGLDELAAAWADGWRAEPRVENEAVARQLVHNRRVMAAAVDTRFFAARVDGQIGSYCELYFDDRTAQIEDVLTLEPFRNRGLARATVSRALDESRAAGHDLTFLIADRDGWTKQTYSKIGLRCD